MKCDVEGGDRNGGSALISRGSIGLGSRGSSAAHGNSTLGLVGFDNIELLSRGPTIGP